MSEIKGDVQVRRNTSTRNLRIECDSFTTSNSTRTLNNFSATQNTFTGSLAGQIVNLGDATSYATGHLFQLYNASSAVIAVEDFGDNSLLDLFPFQKVTLSLTDNGSTDGVWNVSYEIGLQQVLGQTIDATPLAVQVLTLPTDTTAMLETRVVAKWVGGSAGAGGDGGAFVRTAHFNNIAGAASLLRMQTDFTSTTLAGMAVTYDVSGADVSIMVTGAANSNIDWQVSTEIKLF